MRWNMSYLVAGALLAVVFLASTAVVTRPEPRPVADPGGMMGAPARGHVMMSGMMMGHGMMPGATSSGAGQPGGNDAAGRLTRYVQQQGLSCMGCHALTGRLAAPSFTEIARRYAGRSGARATLAQSIEQGVAGKWSGYGPMPSGLASQDQAGKLSGMILELGH